MSQNMRRRPLGKTGMMISEIGFGAWPVGGKSYGAVDEKDAVACMEAYLDAGGNFIDTARNYNVSEEILGRVLATRKNEAEKVIIASKTGATGTIAQIPNIRRDLETSLRYLGRDYLDLYYLHAPPEDIEVIRRVLDEFLTLKAEGKIHAIGASIKGPNVTGDTVALIRQYLATGMVDAIQLIYSIFRQKNAEIFEEAARQGVGIVARTVLENGFLTGKYLPGHQFQPGDHRSRWSRGTLDGILVETGIVKDMAVRFPYENLAQVAIAFATHSPHVSTAIVGAKSVGQVRTNVTVEDLPALDPRVYTGLVERYRNRTEEFNF